MIASRKHHRQRIEKRRLGFTLLELLLSLGLTVLVTSLVGFLIQLYIAQNSAARERIQRAQLARTILTTIAEDIRSVIRYQPYDSSALEQVLSGAVAGMVGGGAGGLIEQAMGATGDSATSDLSTGDSTVNSSSPPPPPGLYGTQAILQIDVSRLPRPDQYFVEQRDLFSGQLADVPSDIKQISYTVQAPSSYGVQDPLATGAAVGSGGGLVRRELDRSISQWATEQGQGDSLNRTGEILASEVLGIQFQYFDGAQWFTEWDSSQLGLPALIAITIAMQDPIVAAENPVQPGLVLSGLDTSSLQASGIQIYSLSVAIPGAMLLPKPSTEDGSGNDASGMGSLGL
ncbi:MAG: hypothetical protein ACK56Q_01290 [Pirellulaceae bacterium]